MMDIRDAVILDLIPSTREYCELAKIIEAEKGLHTPNAISRDMVYLLCSLKQGILEGKTYLEPIYHRAIALAVDTINLKAVNAEAQERKAALATAPYYNVVVEIDGVESSHTVQALSREDAARQVLDNVTLGAEASPDKVKLISYDLA